MSIVALSATTGSRGDEIGQEVAHALGCEFVNREIIAKAAERFGESVVDLAHATEERPTFWERVTHGQRRYTAAVEAIVLDIATRERAVLSGRGAPIILAGVPYVLRVRVTASIEARASRAQQQHGLTEEAATDWIERADSERAARIRFLYRVDWSDPHLYDLVISTDRLSVGAAARIVRAALEDPRYAATPEARLAVVDRRIVVEAREALLRSSVGDPGRIGVVSHDGRVTLSGMVGDEATRHLAERLVAPLSGVREVVNQVMVVARGRSPNL